MDPDTAQPQTVEHFKGNRPSRTAFAEGTGSHLCTKTKSREGERAIVKMD